MGALRSFEPVLRRTAAAIVAVAAVSGGTAAAFEWARDPAPELVPELVRRPRFAATLDASAFLKGDLHAHTNRSDGDNAPEEVIGWYRRHGYAFLAITDHNRFFDPERYASLTDDHFRLLPGEEITMLGGGRQVHVNALCTRHRIGGGVFPTAADALSWATARVAADLGVAIVNHPNFDRALLPNDLLAAESAPLLEIMSGHPYVYSRGVGNRPSHEALWDFALARGVGFMGVAVDDMHHLRVDADPPAYPGSGWVEVFADRGDPAVLCSALRRGRLYASTGMLLRRVRVTDTTYEVWPDAASAVVSFIGSEGRVLRRVGPLESGGRAAYELSGNEGYVRATVTGDSGTAWTPGIFVVERGVPSSAARLEAYSRP